MDAADDSGAKPHFHKCMWTAEEDDRLMRAVETCGVGNWRPIAELVKTRSAKQCRERWSGMLSPSLTRQAWTPEEDARLLELHSKFGNKWSAIATMMPGRSRIGLRNRWSWNMKQIKLRQGVPANAPSVRPPPDTSQFKGKSWEELDTLQAEVSDCFEMMIFEDI